MRISDNYVTLVENKQNMLQEAFGNNNSTKNACYLIYKKATEETSD